MCSLCTSDHTEFRLWMTILKSYTTGILPSFWILQQTEHLWFLIRAIYSEATKRAKINISFFFSNRSIILLLKVASIHQAYMKYTSSYGLLFVFCFFFLCCNDIFWSNRSEWRDNLGILHFCTDNLRISALINKTKYTIVCLCEKVNKRGMSVSIKQIKYLLSVEGRQKQRSSVNKCHLCPLQCGTVLYYLPQKLKQKVNQARPVLFSTVSHSVCLCYITLQWHIDCPS